MIVMKTLHALTKPSNILANVIKGYRVMDSIALVCSFFLFRYISLPIYPNVFSFIYIDINECNEKGGENGHHCNINTTCLNVYGSYECHCLEGYSRVDKWNCVEIDECLLNQHMCHENADCINTPGSYKCRCKSGFTGDGRYCVPICDPSCLNGGECVAPNKCLCRGGYEGSSCEKDLDECKTNQHGCTNTSVCVNMPGWYVNDLPFPHIGFCI